MQNWRTCTRREITSSRRSSRSRSRSRLSNRHLFVMNQIFVTDDVIRQRLISKRPIDEYEDSALSLRRLSNEVEEQIAPLNNTPWIAAASCYADCDHRPGLF